MVLSVGSAAMPKCNQPWLPLVRGSEPRRLQVAPALVERNTPANLLSCRPMTAAGNAVYAAVIGRHDSRLAGVFRSTNAGATWSRLGSEPRTNGSQGWLHFGIAADPTDNTIVYIAGDASN